MSEPRSGFVQEIAADIFDDSPRLVFADWLEERGEAPRAAFIRLQCEAWKTRRADRRFELVRQADDLLLEHERSWLGRWHEALVAWEFHRGFIFSATITAKNFLERGPELFHFEPVYRLGVVNDEGEPLSADEVSEVVAHRAFGNVQSLDIVGATPARIQYLPYARKPFPIDAWLNGLAQAAHVRRLKSFCPSITRGVLLNFWDSNTGIDPSALEAFCQSSHLQGISSLDLRGCPLLGKPSEVLGKSIAGATFAARLRRLRLQHCRLTDAGIDHLAATPALSGLRKLDLVGNDVSVECIANMFRSPHLTRLKDVSLHASDLPAYSNSPLPGRAVGLTVVGGEDEPNRAVQHGWRRLLEQGRPPRRLKLICHDPGAKLLEKMIASRWLRHVRSFTIENDSQSPGLHRRRLVWQMLKRNTMPRLKKLRLHEFANDRFVEALAQWPGLKRLEQLALTDDYYGRCSPMLLDSPYLSERMRTLTGVRIETDDDVERLSRCNPRPRLRATSLAILGLVSSDAIEALFRHPLLSAIEEMQILFQPYRIRRGDVVDDAPREGIPANVYRILGNRSILPRLRFLKTMLIGDPHQMEEIAQKFCQRFGPRLHV